MQILACADLHDNQAVYRWLASAATEFAVDRIVLAGDLFGFADGFDTIEEAQQTEAAATRRAMLIDLDTLRHEVLTA